MKTERFRIIILLIAVLSTLIFAGGVTVSDAAEKGTTKCKITFNLSGWAAFYETASGSGTITCNNGQSAKVKIRAKGGGLTAGKYSRHGQGSFSEVTSIRQLYGSYAKAEAHAGAVKSATAQVVTKGNVSLSLTATGSGFDLGIGFGKFVISPVGKAAQ
jgi:hypothetical protein